jgi:Flp pilus assembly CpaE family ATPase
MIEPTKALTLLASHPDSIERAETAMIAVLYCRTGVEAADVAA